MAKAAKRSFSTKNVEVEYQTLDNPDFSRDHAENRYGNYRKTTAAVNIRESSIGTMKARKIIDEAQAEAALRFRRLWEAMGGAGAGAMDYMKEPVDGGGPVQTITDRQIDAGRRLKKAQEHLGIRNYTLVCRVAGEGFQISELFQGRRAQDSAMDALRGALDDLSELWDLKARTTMNRRCA